MEFNWHWYVAAFLLMVVRNWWEILYVRDPGISFRLLGAYLVDLLIMYVVFNLVKQYRERKDVE